MTGIFNRPLNAAVGRFGGTSHAWMGVFILACLIPVSTAVYMSW